jgi:hypothetical protein
MVPFLQARGKYISKNTGSVGDLIYIPEYHKISITGLNIPKFSE